MPLTITDRFERPGREPQNRLAGFAPGEPALCSQPFPAPDTLNASPSCALPLKTVEGVGGGPAVHVHRLSSPSGQHTPVAVSPPLFSRFQPDFPLPGPLSDDTVAACPSGALPCAPPKSHGVVMFGPSIVKSRWGQGPHRGRGKRRSRAARPVLSQTKVAATVFKDQTRFAGDGRDVKISGLKA